MSDKEKLVCGHTQEYWDIFKEVQKHTVSSPETKEAIEGLNTSMLEIRDLLEEATRQRTLQTDRIEVLSEEVKPVVEAYQAATLSSQFIVKLAQFILAFALLGGSLVFILKGIGKW